MSTAEKLRSLVADRFEPNGSAFLYRNGEGAPGRAVSAEERRRFVAAFERHVGWLAVACNVWVGVGAAVALAWLAYRQWHSNLATPAVFWGTLLLPTLLAGWLATAPDRALKHRPPADPGLPKSERWRRRVATLSWGRLGWDMLGAAIVLALLFHKPLGPVERLVLVALALANLALVLCVLRLKLRFRGGKGGRRP